MTNTTIITRMLTALLLLVLSASAGWAQNSASNDDTAIATLEEFEGSVFVERAGETTAAEVGMRLERDDVVITRAASSAVIRFDYGCVIRLPENQRLTIRDGAMCCVDDEADPDGALARLSGPQGTITVRRGAEELPGEHDMALLSGDRIMTGDQSEVIIAYERGCDVRLGANQQYDVTFAEECCLSMLLICVAGTPVGDGLGLASGAVVAPYAITPAIVAPLVVAPPIASIIADDNVPVSPD